jgi:PAS domain S-box-containing protein
MPPERVADRRRSTAAHVRSILDNTLDAVLALDENGRVTFWNPRAEETFGWTRAQAVGAHFSTLALPEASRAAFGRCLAGFRDAPPDHQSCRVELDAVRREGASFPVELTVSTIPGGGDFHLNVFARDITQRRRDEAERENLLEETEKARAQAEMASRAKDEFLSTLSHELRTPLTAIVGWTYLLRGGRLDSASAKKGLEAIERNASTQAQVISDILDLSRIVGARFHLNVRPLQLAPVVAAALEPLMAAANAKSLKVQTVLDPEAGLVSGDPDRLRQVVWNLVSNAVKFTPRGGRVTVRVERAGASARIVVEDGGEGIAPEFLPHVFERFRQADQSNTRTHGGLGLGLAVVRHLVELHGGTVHAESAGPGQGATFVVALPALEPAQIPEDEAVVTALGASPFPPDALGALQGVKVLLVDDGPDVREVVAGVLRDHGAEVTAAASAAEALRALALVAPDVLVSEIELDGETGLSLIRKVRSLPVEQGGRVPAAAISTFARTEDRVQALLAGFQIHLAKPVQPAELLAVVASLARRDAEPAEPQAPNPLGDGPGS